MSPNITSLPTIGMTLTAALLERYRIEDVQTSLTPEGDHLVQLTTFNLVDRQTGQRIGNYRWSLAPIVLPLNGFTCNWTNSGQQMLQQAMVATSQVGSSAIRTTGGGASRTGGTSRTARARAKAVGSRIQT